MKENVESFTGIAANWKREVFTSALSTVIAGGLLVGKKKGGRLDLFGKKVSYMDWGENKE